MQNDLNRWKINSKILFNIVHFVTADIVHNVNITPKSSRLVLLNAVISLALVTYHSDEQARYHGYFVA